MLSYLMVYSGIVKQGIASVGQSQLDGGHMVAVAGLQHQRDDAGPNLGVPVLTGVVDGEDVGTALTD